MALLRGGRFVLSKLSMFNTRTHTDANALESLPVGDRRGECGRVSADSELHADATVSRRCDTIGAVSVVVPLCSTSVSLAVEAKF